MIRERKVSAEAEALGDRFKDLVESLDAIVWEADARTLQFTFVSSRAETILGYPIEQWLAEPNFWADHLHPDDREGTVAACTRATAEGRDHSPEALHPRRPGAQGARSARCSR